jgi:hypothetical protein
LVGLGRQTFALKKRRAKRRMSPFQSRLPDFVVALSLIVQLFAAATPPAMAAPAFAGADDAAIAAELKALFGDTAQLCVQVNDDKAPVHHNPSGHWCDQCPLCWFAAQGLVFVAPDLPPSPGRLESEAHVIPAPPSRGLFPAYPAQPNPTRAPPLPV